MRRLSLALVLAAAALLPACGKDEKPTTPSAGPGAAPAASPYQLAADPGGGLDVKKAVADGPIDQDVVVVGRVQNVVKGFAAFTLVDVSLKYCGQGDLKDDHCAEPWDYCCVTDQLPGALLPVKVRKGDDVAELPSIPELRPLDLVAVKGRLVKEKDADVTLHATGWYRRERPEVHPDVKFP
jgi:hypothetical protein